MCWQWAGCLPALSLRKPNAKYTTQPEAHCSLLTAAAAEAAAKHIHIHIHIRTHTVLFAIAIAIALLAILRLLLQSPLASDAQPRLQRIACAQLYARRERTFRPHVHYATLFGGHFFDKKDRFNSSPVNVMLLMMMIMMVLLSMLMSSIMSFNFPDESSSTGRSDTGMLLMV